MRFQPRKGKYLAAASEKAIYILDGETQHACRSPLQVRYQRTAPYVLRAFKDALTTSHIHNCSLCCAMFFSFASSKTIPIVFSFTR